jgi:predicted nucleic acid-binding protein
VIDILPDTTAWIDYYNPRADTPAKQKLVALLSRGERIWTCPPVYQEVLQGISISDEKAFAITKKQLQKCRRGSTGIIQAADKAIEIYRTLRKLGITIRKPNDCLIAAYAILSDLAVLHNDRDFDPIEKYFGLKVLR